MLFLTFWLLFGQAKSNKACMADAKHNEDENKKETGDLVLTELRGINYEPNIIYHLS